MRILVQASVPTDQGNQAIQDGTVEKVIQETAERWHPEAMYFTADEQGYRTAFIVAELAESADIVTLAEPLFQRLGATVKMTPVMSKEDLGKGLSQLQQQ